MFCYVVCVDVGCVVYYVECLELCVVEVDVGFDVLEVCFYGVEDLVEL